ncbi:WD repeat-containing protein 34 [Phytophthora pseudosyringae]|uniref:WD repeat-containing protein 34 n=1 Tax=Phytophthora pseudosyringae TaxID=221518 RepID=A0A8T1VZI2_9STRA|nr:WD repeat-containing protein 34 [Phytophthora pseudosyringae]
MFQDVTLGSARFKAKRTKQAAEVCTQTVEIEVFDCEAQTQNEIVSSSTQTGQTQQPPTKGKGKDAAADTQEEDQRRVAECLQMVGGLMLREMAKNGTTSSCFSGLERHLEESEEKDITKLFRLQFDYDTYFQPQQGTGPTNSTGPPSSLRLSCTGVSWNATGSVIAVAYGRFDHSGWCNYRSALCLWNVFQSDLNQLKPSLVLETSSGLMCVAFHPQNPSVVAAGSFNGEVFVWDMEPAEYKFYSSGIGDYFHREPVTKVAWVYDIQTADYNIASVSGDGKILFWRVKDKLAFPVEGYVMHLPQGIGAIGGKSTNDETRAPVIGGKALAFSSTDKASRAFVVGSEGGVVARCFAKTASNVRSSDFKGEKKWTATAARLVSKLPVSKIPAARRQVEAYASAKRSKEVTLATVYEARLDPATVFPSAMDFVFEPHTAPVYDASFSPFRKSIFLTASADGTTRVYSTMQRELLLSLEVSPSSAYLYAAEWSRTRPMVFAAASEDGNVYVFDLKVDRVSPVLVLSGKDPATGPASGSTTESSTKGSAANATAGPKTGVAAPVFALDFNPRQRNFLAAGDSAGVVHIWKLSWQLANFQTGEGELLEALELTS